MALVVAVGYPSVAATSEDGDFEVDSSRPEDHIGTKEEVESNVTDNLATKLRQFDEWTIKTENQTAADAQSASGGANSSGQGGSGSQGASGTQGPLTATDGSRRVRHPSGDANARPAWESESTRIGDRENRAVLPTSSQRRNNPSEEDDVARILRRAAERETDPVRKRELMEQYDEYVRSQ